MTYIHIIYVLSFAHSVHNCYVVNFNFCAWFIKLRLFSLEFIIATIFLKLSLFNEKTLNICCTEDSPFYLEAI